MIGTILLLAAFGALLLVVEFMVPGAVIGILGILALISAVVLSFLHYGVGGGLVAAVCVSVTVAAFVTLWMKYFHRTYFGRILTLNSEVPTTDVNADKVDLVGKTGIAHSDLRPVGKAIIEGEKFDVVANLGLIEKGTQIEILSVDGLRIVVRAL